LSSEGGDDLNIGIREYDLAISGTAHPE